MNTRKIMMFLMFALIISSTAAYAATSSSNGTLTLDNVDPSDSALIIGLSPKVEMYHVSNGANTLNSQWYAISSAHPGGNVAYGTAQDVNNVYHRNFNTTAVLSSHLQSIPTVAASATAWTSTGLWSRD